LMLVGIIALYFIHQNATGVGTFDYAVLTETLRSGVLAISPRASIHLPGAPYYLAAVLLLSSLLLAAYVTRPSSITEGTEQQPTASFEPSD